MKRLISMIFVVLTVSSIIIAAQTQAPIKKQPEVKIYQPTFIVSDIYFATKVLDGVELTGNEVNAFLDVKKHLDSYLETAKNKKLKVAENLQVEMPAYIAQNILTFLNRTKIRGNMAEQFKRFINSIIEAPVK